MKVYFSSSVRAKKLYKKNFDLIYQDIQDLGYIHTSDFLIKANADDFYTRKTEDFNRFYENLTTQIKKADVCVFEVSLHSLGIGYCVDLALQMEKPVILLHLKDRNPSFFSGIKSDKLQVFEYSLDNLKDVLTDALDVAKNLIDIRFTFFITPKIVQFLDSIAKKKKIPRAVYLRQLLEQQIKKANYK